MRHEYFPTRIKRLIESSDPEKPTPTFSGGAFLPDLVNQMKDHLRKIEIAQLSAVQEYKEVVQIRNVTGTRNSKFMDQIMAHRKRNG